MLYSAEKQLASEYLREDATQKTADPRQVASRNRWSSSRTLLLISIAIFASLTCTVLPRWHSSAQPESLGRPEHRHTSQDLDHRSACSAYPEDCQKTAPFVFDSVYSLLKQWPSSYAPNGHSVVPAKIPPNTLLYHVSPVHGTPEKSSFFAFDAEMSFGIFGSDGTPRLHKMTTTRQLDVIYLDGHSASLTTTGSLDSQMAILGNQVPPDPTEDETYNEDKRAVELCNLARELNIDGIVRMNAGFEVLVCNWPNSGIRQLFVTDVTVPGNKNRNQNPSLPDDPHRQPPLGYGNDFAEQNGWEWVRSATWHYGNGADSRGSVSEKRVLPDLCGFTSWYDPSLRSLSGSHHNGLRGNNTYENGWGLRRGHRLLGVTEADTKAFRKWMHAAVSATLGSKKSLCSGTDWQTIVETIVDNYYGRVREILFYLEREDSDPDHIHQIIDRVYPIVHAILFPYLEYPIIANMTKSQAKAQTLRRCSTAYTGHIEEGSLSEFEALIKESTFLVVSRLCQWAWDTFEWADSQMHSRLDSSSPATDKSSSSKLSHDRDRIKQKTQSLLKWIGWDVSQSCEEKCAPDEICYIPMWPVIYAPNQPQGGIYGGGVLNAKQTREFWQPKCLNRIDFDCGGGRAREPAEQLPRIPYEKCLEMKKKTMRRG